MGWAALGATCAFALLVALLHVVRPEFRPSNRMMSEYAMGRPGYVMRVAFYALAAACASTAIGLGLWAAGILFALLAVGALGAGLFVTDPTDTAPGAGSRAGMLHNASSFLVIPLFPVAATVAMAGHSPLLALGGWRWLLCVAVWAGFVAFAGWPLYTARSRPAVGLPEGVGYAQRFMVLTYVAWLLVAGWTLAHAP
jgi:hypothetical protein